MHINLNNTEIQVITQRRTRARKTLDMEFTSKTQLLITLPTTQEIDLETILKQNRTLLARKHQEYLKRTKVLEDNQLLIDGTPRKLIIETQTPEKGINLTDTTITIHTTGQQPGPILKEWMTQQTRKRIQTIQQKHSLETPEHLRIVDTARWGYVRDKTIHINNQLTTLPPPLQEFITVHEHLHLQHMNHGPIFQAKLREKIPNYPTLEYELKKYLALDYNNLN